MVSSPRCYLICPLLARTSFGAAVFRLDFEWPGPAPAAGQFFMLKSQRGSPFLPRPVSVYRWDKVSRRLSFLVLKRGRGTGELGQLRTGEGVALTGPLGNCWKDFLPRVIPCGETGNGNTPAGGAALSGTLALVGGGIGIAPLAALGNELGGGFDLYAGFKSGSFGLEFLRDRAAGLLVASEDGSEGRRGRIPDFVEYRGRSRVFACGPLPMLRVVAEHCRAAQVPCYISMEQFMACGVGACLGCTVKTAAGNRRCCADGPIFPAADIFPSQPSASDGPIFPAADIFPSQPPASDGPIFPAADIFPPQPPASDGAEAAP
ncbi:MAG: dihydroorotate dehydrogenase electron transfer subunit [Treponema sp.]|jgi:NAD(P)H-flavin reductase|nr:dihydroorotate dehydrogenase electron transfer subunit [Treponema sp.]